MSEFSTQEAAQIVGCSHTTIWEQVKAGELTARRQGLRGIIRIEEDDLRSFAERYNYRYNEALARQLADN